MKKLKKMTFANIDKMLEANQIQALPELQSIVGGGSGTSSDPFSWNEFDYLCETGNWTGGYVDGQGYVSEQTMIFNGNSTLCTFGEYLGTLYTSPLDAIGDYLLGNLPIVNEFTQYNEYQFNNARSSMLNYLYANGYTGEQQFYIVCTPLHSGQYGALNRLAAYTKGGIEIYHVDF